MGTSTNIHLPFNNFQAPSSCSDSVISVSSCSSSKTKKKKPKQKKKKLAEKSKLKNNKPKMAIKRAIKVVQELLKKSTDPFQALKLYLKPEIKELEVKKKKFCIKKNNFNEIVKITKQLIQTGTQSSTKHKMTYRNRIFSTVTAAKKPGVAKNRCAKKLLRYIVASQEVDLWTKYDDMIK